MDNNFQVRAVLHRIEKGTGRRTTETALRGLLEVPRTLLFNAIEIIVTW